MTDLTLLPKTELNTMLAAPLNAPALKKIGKPDLIRMILAQDAEKAAPSQEPTLAQVIDGLTDLEKRVLVAHLDAGMDCNGAETLDAMRTDNMTWSDVAETAQRTGLTKKQVNGVLSSLSTKGLVVTDCDPVNGEGAVQQVLADFGIVVAFELVADGIEANPSKAAPAPKAEKPANPAPKKARVLEDRVLVAPATDMKMVRPVGEGSKRHLLAQALLTGATVERLMEVTGWNRATAASALRWDIPQMGLGVERKGDIWADTKSRCILRTT